LSDPAAIKRIAAGFFRLSAGAGDEEAAESRRLQIALALRGHGDWPAWAAGRAAVERWLSSTQAARGGDVGLLAAYEGHLRAEVHANWATTCLGHLRELETTAGLPLFQVTPTQAQAFLDEILRSSGPRHKNGGARTVATRNRALAACSRFFKWGVRTGRD